MRSLENAVPEVLEELELTEFYEHHIHEVRPDVLYHVTFQDKRNGNNKLVVSVEYTHDTNLLEWWEENVHLEIVESHGLRPAFVDILLEELELAIDPDYEESDDDAADASTISQPLTPPPSRARLA